METPVEEMVLDQDHNTEIDWFGWAAIVCAVAGVLVGMIPIIGNYFRLALGIVGLGLALGGVFENRKRKRPNKIPLIALALNVAVLIWVCISLTVIGGILMGLVANIA